jgi:hypothetical protein
MIRRVPFASLLMTVTAFILASTNSASAQSLLFNLPEDGTMVEYEGKLVQSTGPDDPKPLEWACELTIKSVGKEEAEFEGKTQPCRWIEIKTLTGKAGAAGIDPGPVGARIYKVLVPESKVIAEWQDADGIPNEGLPFIKGFRRLGEEEVKPITEPGLRFYPTITLLNSYREPEVVATSDVPETLLQGQTVNAKRMKGKLVMESEKVRSSNEADYWVSEEVPFGLARWIVTVTTAEKDSTAPVSEFKLTTLKKVDMKLRRIRDNAESELVTE